MSQQTAGPVRQVERGTILLVEDNAELVRGLAKLLSNDGYEVVSLANGANISETIALRHPDLVVLDVMMPVVDGWEALRKIRQNPATAALPVMMLTAKGTEDAKVKGFKMGADDYLSKPFSVAEFRCRVEALLRRARQEEPRRGVGKRLAVVGECGTQFVDLGSVAYLEGVRNYSHVHTYDSRFLGRFSLGDIEKLQYPGLMRVHRSYIVRLEAVKGFFWASKSSFRLVMDTEGEATIPVSRTITSKVKQKLIHSQTGSRVR